MPRPLLFLDVDGPLNPYGTKVHRRPEGYLTHRVKPASWIARHPHTPPAYVKPLRLWLNPEHGPALLALPYQLVWCTTWKSEANEHIAPLLGLPELPFVDWPRMHHGDPDGLHWKTRYLTEWADGRPFVWADDELEPRDTAWIAAHHPAPRVDPLHRPPHRPAAGALHRPARLGRAVNRLVGLRRYPVKSMLGEDLTAVGVSERGLDGDRIRALQDLERGKVASAKLPRLWGGLLQFEAAAGEDGEVRITHGGEPVRPEELSARLGRPVRLIDERPDGAELERAVPEEVLAAGPDAEVGFTVNEFGKAAPAGTFFDFAPVHLIATATLGRLAALHPRGTVDLARYRPNLILDLGGEPFAENGWTGRELAVGPDLRLELLVLTPRCAVPTLAHGELPRDPDALRLPARHNRVEPLPGLGLLPCVGGYARVLHPGRISLGDPVVLH